MKIFLCAPYTPREVPFLSEDYIYRQNAYIDEVNEMGKKILLTTKHIPIIPHNLFQKWEHDKRFTDFPHDKWIEITIMIMLNCNGIFLMPGWDTAAGCIKEFKAWKLMYDTQNIYHCIEDLPR